MTERPRVHVIATQHLDVAWLWPRVPYGEELMRQCFERALELIEADPETRFVFSRSTAWSFWIIEQRYPELFEQVRARVADGTLELCGGEWVEPDHLIPDGESLVRQCALGQWYFLDKFGQCASVCWDPDIFGHPHSLPQILVKCGLEGFYSHRCRPRDAQGNPLHQFVWEGPDGSRVFYLAGSWIGAPDTAAIEAALAEQGKHPLPAIHVVTGLRSDRRITMQREWVPMPASAAADLDLPSCRWSSAAEVLADMMSYADQLPVVRGELGFQFTGTYTSNGFNKRMNRRMEALLVDAEKAATWASTMTFRYPAKQLTQAWRDHCVNQFHDIICGCSVAEVHAEDRALWAEANRRATFARDEALAYLCDRIHAGLTEDLQPTESLIAAFNFLSWPRRATIELPLAEDEEVDVFSYDGVSLPVQVSELDGTRRALVRTPAVPGIGYTLLRLRRRPATAARDVASAGEKELVLENGKVRVAVDRATGELTSLRDKATGQEYLAPGGRGNRLLFLEDDHPSMPAWSMRYTGRELDPGTLESIAVLEDGPLRQTIRTIRVVHLDPALPPTRIVQDIMLYDDSPLVIFKTYGDWYASRVTLKAAFDLALEWTSVAAEAPYAVVTRPTERAAGESVLDADVLAEDGRAPAARADEDQDRYMQKWLDVSNGKRGVLFVNDGLYGYDTRERQVRLSLLRAPLDSSDRLGDLVNPRQREITGLGPFAFTYGILAHSGGWQEARAPHRGYEFNHALIVKPVRDGFEPAGVWRDWWDTRDEAPRGVPSPFIQVVKGRSGILTVVKRAEDGRGIILRLVESYGQHDTVVLRCLHPIRAAIESDLLERPLPAPATAPTPSVNGAEVTVSLAPWEIKTVRVIFE